MADCPLADECPSFSERIQGMGCQHYGDRGGAEWCNHYDMPISELKQQPVQPGEEVVVEVDDIHESGAGVGRTEDGFIVLVDGLLPPARATVRIDRVKSNHATAKRVIERLPEAGADGEGEGEGAGEDEAEAEAGAAAAGGGETAEAEAGGGADGGDDDDRKRLGSRENFWGR